MNTLLLILAACFQAPIPPKAPVTLRDSSGRYQGTATPKGTTIVLRDSRGRLTGSVIIKGKSAQVFDNRGRRK